MNSEPDGFLAGGGNIRMGSGPFRRASGTGREITAKSSGEKLYGSAPIDAGKTPERRLIDAGSILGGCRDPLVWNSGEKEGDSRAIQHR